MSWSEVVALALLASLGGCSLQRGPEIEQRGHEVEACPRRENQPLRFVDVFDGPPAELAQLIPDEAGERSGYWRLDYIYAAGRSVTIRCKYADRQAVDVRLSDPVDACRYRIDADGTLTLRCR